MYTFNLVDSTEEPLALQKKAECLSQLPASSPVIALVVVYGWFLGGRQVKIFGFQKSKFYISTHMQLILGYQRCLQISVDDRTEPEIPNIPNQFGSACSFLSVKKLNNFSFT